MQSQALEVWELFQHRGITWNVVGIQPVVVFEGRDLNVEEEDVLAQVEVEIKMTQALMAAG